MLINQLEEQIISRLKQEIPDLLIEGFPEKPEQFQLIHPKGAILVHYQGADYSNTKATDAIVQDKKLEFALTVVTRHLRSNEGAYAYLDDIRRILTGYKIDGCSKMYPVKENFLSENAGIWQYSINFVLTTPVIEVRE